MVQYSSRAKTCHQSEKDGTILKQCQYLSPVRKTWYNTQAEPKPDNSQKKMTSTILKQSQNLSTVRKKDGTILKQCQNLSPFRKRWYNTQTVPKPVNSQKKRWYNTQTVPKPANSQKKMVQYSNRAKTCQQSEKDGTILKQSKNMSSVRKRWYNTRTVQKPDTSWKRWYNTQTVPKHDTSQKKIVQYSNRAKTCHQSEKDGPILKQGQNLPTVRKRN